MEKNKNTIEFIKSFKKHGLKKTLIITGLKSYISKYGINYVFELIDLTCAHQSERTRQRQKKLAIEQYKILNETNEN